MNASLVRCCLAIAGMVSPLCAQPDGDRFFDNDGVRIRYIDQGRGEPIVLIHGFASNLDANWRDIGVVDALANDFRVIALDLRGHGRSDKPHRDAAYGIPMVDDVVALLDYLRLPSAHIVGYSMGGAVTGKLLVTRGERVASAVFVGSAPRLPDVEQDRLWREGAEAVESGEGLGPILRMAMAPNEPPPSDEELEERSRLVLRGNDPLALAGVMRGIPALSVPPERLREIATPMLAVVGTADPFLQGVEAFARAQGVRLVLLEGAVHGPPAAPRGTPRQPALLAAIREHVRAHPTEAPTR